MKYRNKPCELNGHKYRSQKERDRHQELLMMQMAGVVRDVLREVPFVLAPGVKVQGRGRPPLRYIADFTYRSRPAVNTSWDLGSDVVEDCKGVRTTAYNIKRHLMKAVHGIEILET